MPRNPFHLLKRVLTRTPSHHMHPTLDHSPAPDVGWLSRKTAHTHLTSPSIPNHTTHQSRKHARQRIHAARRRNSNLVGHRRHRPGA